jgi:hypothetical protein
VVRFHIAPELAFSVGENGITAIEQPSHMRLAQEIDMNVRTITTLLISVALMATTAGVYAAQQFGRDSVYVHAGTPATSAAPSNSTSSASHTQLTRFGRDSIYVTKDSVLSKPSAVNSAAMDTKFGRS